MVETLGGILPLALGVAVSPIPIVATILLLISPLPRVPVVGPVIAYLAARKGMGGALQSLRAWLGQNNAVVMAILLLVIGVTLTGKGIASI